MGADLDHEFVAEAVDSEVADRVERGFLDITNDEVFLRLSDEGWHVSSGSDSERGPENETEVCLLGILEPVLESLLREVFTEVDD